ncbi:MAG: riboflavin synthase [Actinomycetota bacterium]
MFTGIVEEMGAVRSLHDRRLVVGCQIVTADSTIGSSVAVNGICLTVVECGQGHVAFDLSEETISRTALRRLEPGSPVNLERPVTLAARLGGHVVQGHVDGVGEVVATTPESGGGVRLRARVPSGLRRYTIEKGSITLDGVSLTVADLHDDGVTVALIPHTLAVTTLGRVGPGDPVNLEVDMIAKYLERLLTGYRDPAGDSARDPAQETVQEAGGRR